MNVQKMDGSSFFQVPPRRMTVEAMQKDFDYEMAQKLTKQLLSLGKISVDEFNKISDLNRKRFCPFIAEVIDERT